MKELSIEEKAKRYDKSFERAKEQLNDAKVFDYDNEQIAHDIRTTVYNIFPELKESEDEKIRKALLNEFIHLQSKGYKFAGLEGEEIVAWLQKQSEQPPAWSEEDEMIALSIEQVMNCASLLNIVPEKIDKIRTWLKALKDRVGCEVNQL